MSIFGTKTLNVVKNLLIHIGTTQKEKLILYTNIYKLDGDR